MNAALRPRFEKGIRLRNEPGAAPMLLVPEGALLLNAPAAAALELVDGERSIAQIARALEERFDVSAERAREDVDRLFERLVQRRFLYCS